MTIERVKQAAAARGIFFDGVKKWQNNFVGYGYFCYTPYGCGFIQADTLQGMYKNIMKYKKVK